MQMHYEYGTEILRGMGKHESLLVVCRRKKHAARLRGSGELNMVCSCRRAALQGRHQRTKLAQSCQNCYGNTSPQQIQTPLPVLWRSPLRVPSISIRLNLPITTCSSVPVSHSFFHFSAFLAHCLSQSLSQWAVSIKRWSTFESAASLKSSHLFLLYFPSRLLTSSLISCSIFNTRPFPFFFFFYPPCSISFLAKLRLLVFCNFSSLHLLFFPLWSGNYHVLPPLARRLFLIDLTWPWHWTFVHFIKA